MAATKAVLSIYELVEPILLNLRLYDILIASTTDQRLWNVTKTSSTIRKQLQTLPLSTFVLHEPGYPETQDMCNVNFETPWFFRIRVPNGAVLLLQIRYDDIQLYIPDDISLPVRRLMGSLTRGAYYQQDIVRRGFIEFYEAYEKRVCRKDEWTSPWTRQKTKTVWTYVQVFCPSECEFYEEQQSRKALLSEEDGGRDET